MQYYVICILKIMFLQCLLKKYDTQAKEFEHTKNIVLEKSFRITHFGI